jgi:tetratricopeptide (TPR) repeat protein
MKPWDRIAKLAARTFRIAHEGTSAGEALRRGMEYERAGEHGKAQDCYRRVLAQEPENVNALDLLGQLLSMQGYAHQEHGELDAAIESYEESLALAPRQPQVHNNLGNAYKDLGRLADAITSYREAISMDRGYAEAHLNLGNALQQTGEIAQATAHYRAALEFNPRLADAALNLGYVLEHDGEAHAAIACYRQAIAARQDFAEAHFNLALQSFLTGDYITGWAEYEWRLRLPALAPLWPYAGRPRWDGGSLGGKTILLYAEQGFGDAIQFVRYASLVAERGGKVIVVCQPKLKALFESVAGVSAVLSTSAPHPEFDVCCSLLSLPRIFKTTVDSIPAQVPYVHPDGERLRHWRTRLASDAAPVKVGLCWATEGISTIASARSLALDMLAPLGGIQGIAYYSLQRGSAARQLAQPPPGMSITDLSGELRDFSDDAALMSNLDLVISIDTATAHLAGALGGRAWTLTHYPPNWRWLLGRDDCPWYPAMRLFRRQRDDAWQHVIARVALALEQLVAQRSR